MESSERMSAVVTFDSFSEAVLVLRSVLVSVMVAEREVVDDDVGWSFLVETVAWCGPQRFIAKASTGH